MYRQTLFAVIVIAAGLVPAAKAQNYDGNAQSFCDQYFASAFSRTEGYNWSNGAVEVSDVRVEVRAADLTSADSLNGTLWKGFVFYKGVAVRQSGAAWQDHSDPVFQCSLQLSSDGSWHGIATDSVSLSGKNWTF